MWGSFYVCIKQYPQEIANYVREASLKKEDGKSIPKGYLPFSKEFYNSRGRKAIDYIIAYGNPISREHLLQEISEKLDQYLRHKKKLLKKRKLEEKVEGKRKNNIRLNKILKTVDTILMNKNASYEELSLRAINRYMYSSETFPAEGSKILEKFTLYYSKAPSQKLRLLLRLFAAHGILIPKHYLDDRKSLVDPIYNNYFRLLREKALREKTSIKSQLNFVAKSSENFNKKDFSEQSSILNTENLQQAYQTLSELIEASRPYITEPAKELTLQQGEISKKSLLKLAFTIHSNLVKSACRDEAEIPSELCSFSTFKEFCEECKKLLDVNRHIDKKLSFYKAIDTYISPQKTPVLHEQDVLNTQLEDLKIEEQAPQINAIVDIAEAPVSAQPKLNNKVEEQNQTPVVKENSLKTYGLFKTTDKENIKEKVGAIKSKIKKHLYKNFYIEEVRDEFSRNKTKRLIEEVNKTKHLQDEFNHKLEQGFQFKNLREKMKFSKDVHNWLIKSRYGK